MIRSSFRHRHTYILLTAVGVAAAAHLSGFAWSASQSYPMSVDAGEVFEVGADTGVEGPDFSWILSKDRKFVTAQRVPFFQSRQSVTGTYTLDVNIQDIQHTGTEYRAITLNVNPPRGGIVQSSDRNASLQARLVTDPPTTDSVVTLPEDGGILRLDPSSSQGQVTWYSFDLDGTKDSDGNGVPDDDRDNAGTVSESDGTPLYYLLQPGSTRYIILTVHNDSTGLSSTARITVDFGGSGTPAVGNTPDGISVERSGLTVSLKTQLDPAVVSGSQLLHEWDFGDGLHSLLDSPVHTYSAPGIYAISVVVRNIATGQVVFTATANVQVTPQVTPPPSSSSQPTVTPPGQTPPPATPPPPSSPPSPALGRLVFDGFIVILVFVLLGVVVFVFRRFRRSSGLADTIASMEQKMLSKTPAASPLSPDTTMKLKKDVPPPGPAPSRQPPAEVTEKEKEKDADSDFRTNRPAPLPSPKETAPVPSWLAKANAQPGPAPAPAAAPKPVAAPTPPAAPTPKPPESKPAAQVAPSTPTVASNAPAPAWLQAGMGKTDTPAMPAPKPPVPPTPPPAPKAPEPKPEPPAPPPVPAPVAPKPVTPPVPAPQVPAPPVPPVPPAPRKPDVTPAKESATPDWLRDTAKAAQPASAVTPTPAPAPAAPVAALKPSVAQTPVAPPEPEPDSLVNAQPLPMLPIPDEPQPAQLPKTESALAPKPVTDKAVQTAPPVAPPKEAKAPQTPTPPKPVSPPPAPKPNQPAQQKPAQPQQPKQQKPVQQAKPQPKQEQPRRQEPPKPAAPKPLFNEPQKSPAAPVSPPAQTVPAQSVVQKPAAPTPPTPPSPPAPAAPKQETPSVDATPSVKIDDAMTPALPEPDDAPVAYIQADSLQADDDAAPKA